MIELHWLDRKKEKGVIEYHFYHDHCFSLLPERCPDSELPEEQKILFILREVYRGNLDFGSFLELYSRYGGEVSLR